MTAPEATRSFDVSFVVPLFNKAPFIARALQSALAQMYAAREIVVVDDGSTDGGPEIVAQLGAKHACIRLVRQSNAGPSAARNRGITEARGGWVAFLDADDVVLPEHLARAARMAGRHPTADVLAAAYREVAEGAQAEAARALVDAAQVDQVDAGSQMVDDFFVRWSRGTFFFTSSVVIRRSALLGLGEVFPHGERLGEDHDVWFRLAEQGGIAWTAAVGALYTVGLADSLTGGGGAGRLLAPLPSFARLKQRVEASGFPDAHRRGAKRLIATHWLNVARARVLAGDVDGARQLFSDPITRARPLYRVRSALLIAANKAAGRPVQLGRI